VLKVIIRKSTPEEYTNPSFQFNMLSYVGACIRKDVLIKVGLCRKEFFIYCDDQEHSLRLNKVGKFICVTNSIVDHDSPPFDEAVINWGKYYFKRNDLLMIRDNYPFRYFLLRFIKRYMSNASLFAKKDKQLKKIYRSAFIDAMLNRRGLHKIYRPGWKTGGITAK
jgi:GT2 family glycosyltransferase